MRFFAFVWRADAKEFPGQKGDIVHFVEVEFAEVEGAYRGPMCVVSAQEGVDGEFEGEGRYVVSAHFRRKDRATVLSIEGLERADVVAAGQGSADSSAVQFVPGGVANSTVPGPVVAGVVVDDGLPDVKVGKGK